MFWGCRHQPRWKNIRRQVFRVRGQVKCQCLYATISFWSVLRLFEIERTGMQKYCLDFRMCSTKTSCKNWQLYPYPLKNSLQKTCLVESRQKCLKSVFLCWRNYLHEVHSGHLELALLGFQFLNFRLKPFVDPMPVELWESAICQKFCLSKLVWLQK